MTGRNFVSAQLKQESEIVSNESMKVLKEFERIDMIPEWYLLSFLYGLIENYKQLL